MHVYHEFEVAWEQLRATRWNPPAAAAAISERRATYVFALEQAEQMFRAATTVGIATRPLLVFYGLSQAGRAIAAAASNTDAWKLNGHGVSTVGLKNRLSDIEVRTGKQGEHGSFVRLSELLDSPLWGKAPMQSTSCGTFSLRTKSHRFSTRATFGEPPYGSSITIYTRNCILWQAFQLSAFHLGLLTRRTGEQPWTTI